MANKEKILLKKPWNEYRKEHFRNVTVNSFRMTCKLFPNADVSSLCPEEVVEINRYLFQDVPEEELLDLAAACAKPSFEGNFQTFLNRRFSEAILMEEKNENTSDVMSFLSEF